MVESSASPATEPGVPRPRRRRKPAGSRWMNRLIALGCFASLLPLYYEYRHGGDERSNAFPAHGPEDHEAWVRVIDATELDTGGASVEQRWRHHPRHSKLHASVRSDGSVVALDDDAGEAATNSSATERRHLASIRPPPAPPKKHRSAALPPPPPATATVDSAADSAADTAADGERGVARGTEPAAAPPPNASAADADELAFLRAADRAAPPATHARARAPGGTGGTQRLWRVVPGGVSDVVERPEGGNESIWSVHDVPAPALSNGSWVSDAGALLPPAVRAMIERNLTLVARQSPYRAALLVARRLPADARARRLYGNNLLRHWFSAGRVYERAVLLMVSEQGVAEVVVGSRTQMALREPVARHFGQKASELLQTPTSERRAGDPLAGYSRLEECSFKLVFYVSFMLRSRAALTMLSMRMLSMCMMLFMFMTINVNRRMQQRRYGYALDPSLFERRAGHGGGGGFYLSGMQQREEERFWLEFEAGRGGDVVQQERSRAQAMLQLLALDSVLSRLRLEDEYEDLSDDDLDGDS